jgi:hypothetical protein
MTKHTTYTKEFKLEAIRLLEAGDKPGTQIADNISKELALMLKMSAGKAHRGDLQQVERKWQFIQESVVNSQNSPVLLLVYYNKTRINNLIASSQASWLATDYFYV